MKRPFSKTHFFPATKLFMDSYNNLSFSAYCLYTVAGCEDVNAFYYPPELEVLWETGRSGGEPGRSWGVVRKEAMIYSKLLRKYDRVR